MWFERREGKKFLKLVLSVFSIPLTNLHARSKVNYNTQHFQPPTSCPYIKSIPRYLIDLLKSGDSDSSDGGGRLFEPYRVKMVVKVNLGTEKEEQFARDQQNRITQDDMI